MEKQTYKNKLYNNTATLCTTNIKHAPKQKHTNTILH